MSTGKFSPEVAKLLTTIMESLAKNAGAKSFFDEPDPKEILKVIEKMYEEFFGRYREAIEKSDPLSNQVSKDISRLLSKLLIVVGRGFTMACEDKEFQDIFKEYATLRAKNRKIVFDAYKKAGFTRAEAIALMVHDANNMKDTLSTKK
jgi:hypothetical protein